MTRTRLLFNAVAVFVVCLACSTLAQAQATRTWVSGVGDDVNPCSRTAPCKTFAGAISKTAAGGEINVLDAGGFGAVTITKAITIDGAGSHASILASAVNGIVVNAGANDQVIIRNISINGAGTTLGINGIRFLAGRLLQVENCVIFNFGTHGIDMAHSGTGDGKLVVRNTTFTNIGSVAIRVNRTAGTNQSASVSNVRIHRANIGFDVLNGIIGSISDSVISHVTNQAVVAENTSVINATGNVLTQNGTGVAAFSSGSTINIANNDIFNNTNNGVSVAVGGNCNRFQNNRIFNNTPNNISGACTAQVNQ